MFPPSSPSVLLSFYPLLFYLPFFSILLRGSLLLLFSFLCILALVFLCIVSRLLTETFLATGMRRRIQDLEAEEEAERMRANEAMAYPNGVPNTGLIDMRSLPPTYRQLGGQWPRPSPDWDSVPGLESPQPSSTSPPQATASIQPRQAQSALTQSPFIPVWDEFYQLQHTGIYDTYPVNEEGYSSLQSSPISHSGTCSSLSSGNW